MLLNRIELFVTVARHHNLGKTAREMHVSASSVCQRLKSLENDFGVKLYKKNKEGSIVYKTNRAHGLQFKRQRQGGTCQCLGNKPAPWINEFNLSPIG